MSEAIVPLSSIDAAEIRERVRAAGVVGSRWRRLSDPHQTAGPGGHRAGERRRMRTDAEG